MKSIHLRYFLIVKKYLNVLLYLQILYRRLNAIFRILTRLFYFKLASRKKEILKMQNRHTKYTKYGDNILEKHKVSMKVYQTLWLQGLFVLQLAIVYTLYMEKFHLYCVICLSN